MSVVIEPKFEECKMSVVIEPTPQEHDIAEAANERQIRATQKIFQFSMTQLSQGAGGGVKRQQEQGPRQFMSKARFQGMLTECSKQQISFWVGSVSSCT